MTTTTNATDARIDLISRIEGLLEGANGNRRVRTLGAGAVLACLREVIDGAPWSFEDAGTVANAYQQSAITTFALAARVGGRVYLGITTVSAKGTPTPGRGWKALQPWRSGLGPAGKADDKWAAWVASVDVIEISPAEVDALLEEEAVA